MTIKTYNYLPEEARYIRQTVFVEEQGFKEEFDSVDNTAIHAVAFIDDSPAATGRVFPSEEDGVFYLGRLAVMKEFRKGGTGSAMIKHLEAEAENHGAAMIKLHAQVRAQGFYEKNGYTAEGEIFLEEFEPHITMVKSLKN